MNLIIQHGQEPGRHLPLERGLLTIGRGQDCDLVLPDTPSSRHHAELRRFGDRWLIVDLGSTNGTFVDGVRQAPNQPRDLLPGVPVVIGDTTLVLTEELPAGPPLELSPELEARRAPAPRPVSAAWGLAAWGARGVVALASVALFAGSLANWMRVEVTLPLLGRVVDRTFAGLDSSQGYLFLGVAVLSLLLIVLDVASARWGLAAGFAQALLGAGAGAVGALTVYRYYQLGEQSIFGIRLLDLAQYVRSAVHLTVQTGLYVVAAGLLGVIIGGLLRLVVAGLQPIPLPGREE